MFPPGFPELPGNPDLLMHATENGINEEGNGMGSDEEEGEGVGGDAACVARGSNKADDGIDEEVEDDVLGRNWATISIRGDSWMDEVEVEMDVSTSLGFQGQGGDKPSSESG